MPPGGGRGEHGRAKQDHPPATGRRRDQDTPPLPMPPSPAISLAVYQRRKKQRQSKKQQQAAASIPEGPLVEILSRVPYSSLCRFKCVSKSWLALCSDPDIRKRSPQTLSGFFHNHRHGIGNLKFHNLSGRGPPLVDPALPFLRGYERFIVQQCCGGLLLCQCWKSCADDEGDDDEDAHDEDEDTDDEDEDDDDEDKYDLVVCNPATQKWTVLPPMPISLIQTPSIFFLGFDMAVPSRFVVLVPLISCLDDVAIYSSETGRWIRSGWNEGAVPVVTAECVFLNGFMHLTVDEPFIVAVNTKGGDWNIIPLPQGMEPSYGNTSMGQSQGLLHAWYIDPEDDYQLSVWVLQDYDSAKWTLKHTVNVMELFDTEGEAGFYEMFAIHPERNLIFITNGENTTLSYDMDNQEVHVMCTSGEFLGGLPYIPCFVEWFSDGH